MNIAVVQTGTANTASVIAAFRRLGTKPYLTIDPREVESAGHVVLPGVGAFGPAMERLRTTGVARALTRRVRAAERTLAICLGMQLLASGSDESPGVDGLAVMSCRVKRLSKANRVPHIGWNRVEPDHGDGLVQPGFAYFANSYALEGAPEGWRISRCNDGDSFIAAIERGGVLACQFHPELSGRWGWRLLQRWIEAGEDTC